MHSLLVAFAPEVTNELLLAARKDAFLTNNCHNNCRTRWGLLVSLLNRI
jgi:hypothetical protein